MKNFLFALFSLTVLASVISCAGPQGPAGPPGPQGSGNATILQVYTKSQFKGTTDPFPNLPQARRGEEIVVAGAGFKAGETVKIYVQDQLAATTTAYTEGSFEVKFAIPLETKVTEERDVFYLRTVAAKGDKGSAAVALVMLGQQSS